jgi:GDP-fucose transporter C1
LSIKVTSPITHMVSSAVRGVAASLLGMWLFHDIITTCAFLFILFFHRGSRLLGHYRGRASSIATILLGSILYTWVKHQESIAPSSSSSHSSAQNSNHKYERLGTDDIELGEKGSPKDVNR